MTAAEIKTDRAYREGYNDAADQYRMIVREKMAREQEKEEKRKNLFIQKSLGALLLILTIFIIWALEGDFTVAIVTVPLGLALIFTKKIYLIREEKDETEETA